MSSKGSICCCRMTVMITSFALIGAFLLVLGLVLRLAVVPDVIRNQVDSNVELKPGSLVYEEWVNASTPIYMQYYVFDVKNPEEVFAGTDIPTVEQKGPYSYRELRSNEVLNWSSDSTVVTFMPNRTYVFDPETSCSGCNDKTDNFTTVNIPFLTTALWLNRTNYKESHPSCFFGLEVETKTLEVSLFHKKTVHDILWGYSDPLLEFALLGSVALGCPIPKDLKDLNTSVVQLQHNNTYFGVTAINTGRQDIHKLEQYVAWRGNHSLHWWSNEFANMINGTDGTQFSPRVSKDDVLYGFSPEICRSFYAIYNSTVTLRDISLYRFNLPAELYLSGDVYPPNKGFCVPRCLPTGLLNISLCQPMNPPIAMSPPHFCYGNSSLVKAVRGLSPDEKKHGSFIDVEPITGIVMHAAKRLQVNVALEPVNVFPESDGKFEPVFLPVLWVSENAMISEKKAATFRHKVYFLIALTNVFELTLIALGALFIVVAICLLTFHAVRSGTGKDEAKRKSDERRPLVGDKREVYT